MTVSWKERSSLDVAQITFGGRCYPECEERSFHRSSGEIFALSACIICIFLSNAFLHLFANGRGSKTFTSLCSAGSILAAVAHFEIENCDLTDSFTG